MHVLHCDREGAGARLPARYLRPHPAATPHAGRLITRLSALVAMPTDGWHEPWLSCGRDGSGSSPSWLSPVPASDSSPGGTRLSAAAQRQKEAERERWKEQWKQQWRTTHSPGRSVESPGSAAAAAVAAAGAAAPTAAALRHGEPGVQLLPRIPHSGGFVSQRQQLGLDFASDAGSESDADTFDLSPTSGSGMNHDVSPTASPRLRQRRKRSLTMQSDSTRAASSAGAAMNSAPPTPEVVRQWSQLYRMTSKSDDQGVEARGKKAQYESHFKSESGTEKSSSTGDTVAGGFVGMRWLKRVAANPWAWLNGTDPSAKDQAQRGRSLLLFFLRCFFVCSVVRSIANCHLQWYNGERSDYVQVLTGLLRASLFSAFVEYSHQQVASTDAPAEGLSELTVPKLKARLKELGAPVNGEKDELIKRLTGLLFVEAWWEWLHVTLIKPCSAPAIVLTGLGLIAWLPAWVFIQSKIRNWDWAEKVVNSTTGFNLSLKHRNQTIVAMMASDDAIRARQQTELLFMWGSCLCIVAYILLLMLSTWLTWQRRRLDALQYWRQLSKSHFDGIFQKAFKKYDTDGGGTITKDELMKAVQSALGKTYDEKLTSEQHSAIRKMFEEADTDNDRAVSEEEFTGMMFNNLKKWKDDEGTNHTLKEQFESAFDTDNNKHTSRTELQYVMGVLPEHADKSFEQLSDIASLMVEACEQVAEKKGLIKYEQWADKMVLNDDMESTKWRTPVWQSTGAWLFHDAHGFVDWLRSWELKLSSNLPAIKLPLPLILPVAFAPFATWIWRLRQLCSDLQAGPAIACEFQFFQFSWPPHVWVGTMVDLTLVAALGVEPIGSTTFSGLPLTRWTTYLYEDVWKMLTDSVLGTCAALVVGLWEYYQQVEHDRQEAVKQEKELLDAANNILMSDVQFSLCMLSSPLVEENSVRQDEAVMKFKVATLFEVKLKELVKEQTLKAEAIRAAAGKTTPDYPFLHCLQKNIWSAVRGMILNELSGRFSKGYLAEEMNTLTTKKKFFFGLTNEKSAPKSKDKSSPNGKTEPPTQKLRVIVASEELLLQAHEMSKRGAEPNMREGPETKRWATVVNMADLHNDKGNWENSPLREIVLCLPAEDNLSRTQSRLSSASSLSLGNERTFSEQQQWLPSPTVAKQQRSPPRLTDGGDSLARLSTR